MFRLGAPKEYRKHRKIQSPNNNDNTQATDRYPSSFASQARSNGAKNRNVGQKGRVEPDFLLCAKKSTPSTYTANARPLHTAKPVTPSVAADAATTYKAKRPIATSTGQPVNTLCEALNATIKPTSQNASTVVV